MAPPNRPTALALLVALATMPVSPPAEGQAIQQPTMTLDPAKVPEVEVPEVDVSPEQQSTIQSLIAKLAEIDSPDFGLSPSMSGQTFAPLSQLGRMNTFVLGNHQLESSSALLELVKIGPPALPLLLESLEDNTPTKLKIDHSGGFGAMWRARELNGSWVSPRERKVLEATFAEGENVPQGQDDYIDHHTVTVGDACFVAIGQIVGRHYSAIRYQPTACVIVNSPSHDAVLRQRVRDIWTSDQPTDNVVLQSLLRDFATRGRFNGKTLDGWYSGSDLQVSSATRLLYYYPDQATPLIVQRLGELDVMWPADGLDGRMQREVDNGVWVEDFIKAVAWSDRPEIQAALLDILTRTDDVQLALATLPSVSAKHNAVVRKKLDDFLDSTPAAERGAYGEGYNLLVALAERYGERSRRSFDRYLDGGSAQRYHSAAQALRKARGDWKTPLLASMLDDRRSVGGYSMPASPSDDDNRLDIRVCDAAAETLAEASDLIEFTMAGPYENLDKQIARIKSQLPR